MLKKLIRKVGVKEIGTNCIDGLCRYGNDECISAWSIQDHVCNYIVLLFMLAMVDYKGKKMG